MMFMYQLRLSGFADAIQLAEGMTGISYKASLEFVFMAKNDEVAIQISDYEGILPAFELEKGHITIERGTLQGDGTFQAEKVVLDADLSVPLSIEEGKMIPAETVH